MHVFNYTCNMDTIQPLALPVSSSQIKICNQIFIPQSLVIPTKKYRSTSGSGLSIIYIGIYRVVLTAENVKLPEAER